MAADIFSSPDRDRFFKSIDFRWYDLPPTNNPDGIPTPYALYHCQQVERDVVAELRAASAAVVTYFRDFRHPTGYELGDSFSS
jgi:hypothetical protein